MNDAATMIDEPNLGPKLEDAPPASPRIVTGKTVLVWMMCFFGVIFSVNAVFVYLALDSWPGLTTGSAYEDGLAYNETLDQAAAQNALGWKSHVALGSATPKGRVLSVRMIDANGAALSGLKVSALLRRPLGEGLDMDVILQPDGPGRYASLVRVPVLGRWQAVLSVEASTGKNYRMVHDVQAGGAN